MLSQMFLQKHKNTFKLIDFELTKNKSSIKIIADKRYVDEHLKCQLEKERDILLISLKRKNSENSLGKQLRNVLSKTRRIETSFSQLAEQFNINKVLVKSKMGTHAQNYFKNISPQYFIYHKQYIRK